MPLPCPVEAWEAHGVNVARRAVRDIGGLAIIGNDYSHWVAADRRRTEHGSIFQRQQHQASLRIRMRGLRRAAARNRRCQESGRYLSARSTGSVASWKALAAGRRCILFSRCWMAPFMIAARSLFSEKSVLNSRRLCRTLCHTDFRSEEHTSELQSPDHLVCRLLLEKKKEKDTCTETQLSATTSHSVT